MVTLADRARSLKLTLVGFTDPRAGEPMRVAVRLRAGDWLILRHYDAPDRSVLAKKLRAFCRSRRITLVIADADLALNLGCGLHLPQWRARNSGARIRLWRRKGGAPLTVSAHDGVSARRAARLAPEAIFLSPIFATASHPNQKPLGLLGALRVARSVRAPVFALGGIDRTTVRCLARRPGDGPFHGIGAISALF